MPNQRITPADLYGFNCGTDYACHQRLGAHKTDDGFSFTVWAPNVASVRVTGSFCNWDENCNFLEPVGSTGVWTGHVTGVQSGDLYKFVIETHDGRRFLKADPFAFFAELRPGTASVAYDIPVYQWSDGRWLARRARTNHFTKPLNIYEVHLGSWRRHEDGSLLTWRELADTLVPYAVRMGYTHLELMPITEFPFDGSWGYQVTGYFAPTSRFGPPEDLMLFIDRCHRAGLGVLFDWVPGHFCRDAHGLGAFNGDKLFESYDHQQWGTYIFDFARTEVQSFLLSSAMYFVEHFHFDGIRVDGVSSMLYLNFGVDDPREKRYNRDGGEENLDAIAFLQTFNREIGNRFPGVFTIAEESSAWPMVTRPPEDGGLGFHYKWDMGWMNDTLRYIALDFPWREGSHNLLTFSMMYAFSENFVLPLSHDEVVHGKHSLIGRMPGDLWRQFAGLRLLHMYQLTHPGKKLNFMGNEFGQFIEWRYYEQLEWFLLQYDHHQKHQDFIQAANTFYRETPALWADDHGWDGFEWVDADNAGQSVLIFWRKGAGKSVTVLLNFGVQTYTGYRVGLPSGGLYREIFNSDANAYGGAGKINPQAIRADKIPMHGRPYSAALTLPALGCVIIRRTNKK